mmetsp:Transcript_50084/g.119154  ORF Transcript_50084/g.119154 Transcript_50084/m.119154 type:complete len:835 (+) Transcript_50084:18-2522(+)
MLVEMQTALVLFCSLLTVGALPDRLELQRVLTCSSRSLVDFTAVTLPEELPPCVDECPIGADRVAGQCVSPTLSTEGLRLRFFTQQHCELSTCEWLRSEHHWQDHIRIMSMKLAQYLHVPLEELRVAVLSWEVESWPPPPESPKLEFFRISRAGEIDFPGRRLTSSDDDNEQRWFVLHLAFRTDTSRIGIWDARVRVLAEGNHESYSAFLGTDVELGDSEVSRSSMDDSDDPDFAVVFQFEGYNVNESPFNRRTDASTTTRLSSTSLRQVTTGSPGTVSHAGGSSQAPVTTLTSTSTSQMEYTCVVNTFGLGPAAGQRRVAISLQGCMAACSSTPDCTAIEWREPGHCFVASNYAGSLQELTGGLDNFQLLGAGGTWHACLRVGVEASSSSTSTAAATTRASSTVSRSSSLLRASTAGGAMSSSAEVLITTTAEPSIRATSSEGIKDGLQEPATASSSIPVWWLVAVVAVSCACVACSSAALVLKCCGPQRVDPEVGQAAPPERKAAGESSPRLGAAFAAGAAMGRGMASFAAGATYGAARGFIGASDGKNQKPEAGETSEKAKSESSAGESRWARPREKHHSAAKQSYRFSAWPFSKSEVEGSRAQAPAAADQREASPPMRSEDVPSSSPGHAGAWSGAASQGTSPLKQSFSNTAPAAKRAASHDAGPRHAAAASEFGGRNAQPGPSVPMSKTRSAGAASSSRTASREPPPGKTAAASTGSRGCSSMPMPGRGAAAGSARSPSPKPQNSAGASKSEGMGKSASLGAGDQEAENAEALTAQMTRMKRSMSVGSRRRFFLAQCLKWHPDKNAGNEERATRMFQVLQDKKEWFLTA